MKRTSALFAVPNFWTGVAAVVDMGRTLRNYNYSDSPEEADNLALFSDWAAVGDDFCAIYEKVEREHVVK